MWSVFMVSLFPFDSLENRVIGTHDADTSIVGRGTSNA